MTKIAVVTGAGSGIGRACAQAFLAEGYYVALIGRRADALAEAAGDHANALTLACDVTDSAAVDSAFARIAATFGRIDVVFNNAGSNIPAASIDQIAPADWRRVIDVNLSGAFYVARAAFIQMKAQTPQGGRIINNGSISAHAPRPGLAPYTASKHGITGLTRQISLDGRPFDIACGQIDIGNAMTAMGGPHATGALQADGTTKLEPVMDVAHVATSVLYMASLPLEANVQFLTIMATKAPYIGRG